MPELSRSEFETRVNHRISELRSRLDALVHEASAIREDLDDLQKHASSIEIDESDRRTVLIVDDSRLVRTTAAGVLKAEGYRVFETKAADVWLRD